MERRKRLFNWIVFSLCLCLYFTACTKLDPVLINTGASAEQLGDAAKKQDTATAKIDVEATKIEIKTKEPESKDSAVKIKDANKDLKENIAVLKTEAATKDDYMKRYESLLKDYKDLEEKHNSSFRTITYWLYGVGALLFAAGIFLAIKSAGEFWYAPLVGICLVVAAVGSRWVEDHIGKILMGITGTVLLAGIRMWFINEDTLTAAVKVGERLKNRVSPEVKKELFGDVDTPGMVAAEQTPTTKKNITRIRKTINKEWAHIGPETV